MLMVEATRLRHDKRNNIRKYSLLYTVHSNGKWSCCSPKGAVRLTGSRWLYASVLDQKGHHGDSITTTLPVMIGFTIMLLRSPKIDAWVSQATCAQAVQAQVKQDGEKKRKHKYNPLYKGHHHSLLTEPVTEGRQWPPSALQDVFLHFDSPGDILLIRRRPTWPIGNRPQKGT